MINSGLVRVNDEVVTRPAERVGTTESIEVATDPYVSRAAHKLSGALDDLDLQVTGRALDAGASTGGFTQVLLERGATEVIAVDVGTGQLAGALREDPRIRVWEQTNVRDIDLRQVGRPVDLAVADLSFISLITVLDPIIAVTAPEGRLLLLVKPVQISASCSGGWCLRSGVAAEGGDRRRSRCGGRAWLDGKPFPADCPVRRAMSSTSHSSPASPADLRESSPRPAAGRHRTAAATGRYPPLCCGR
jgi:23S rRNA (cytidine1920-2'-O)/16S rRNA (cytidine1409-2'-O)-methyltransferase